MERKVLAMEPRARAIREQFCVLIEFMEKHGDLSRPPPGPQGRIRNNRLWKELANILNSLGCGVKKSSDKWRKVWADWKTKTKKKYLHLRQQASGTSTLTALEQRVVAIIEKSAMVASPPPTPNLRQASASPPSISSPPRTPPPRAVPPRAPPPRAPPPRAPPPHAPPMRNRRQAPTPPLPTATNPYPKLLRRNRGLTPFERAADQFAAIEQRRLDLEEARDKRLHEREMERLRLEEERIEVTRKQNLLLDQLSLLGERLIEFVTNAQ